MEQLLEFLRSLSNDTIICGDALLLAFEFKCQICEPTRVTPTSSTCLDHVITSYQIETDTIQTTIRDLFTVLGTRPVVIFNEPANSEEKTYRGDLRSIKGNKALNFLIY